MEKTKKFRLNELPMEWFKIFDLEPKPEKLQPKNLIFGFLPFRQIEGKDNFYLLPALLLKIFLSQVPSGLVTSYNHKWTPAPVAPAPAGKVCSRPPRALELLVVTSLVLSNMSMEFPIFWTMFWTMHLDLRHLWPGLVHLIITVLYASPEISFFL